MDRLTREDLWSLEAYAERRAEFRREVVAHKRRRMVALGDHVTLLFEDRLLVHYQVQEMLRIERLFEKSAIQEELDAYNPLIPDGRNWKATCLIEYEDVAERRRALAAMRGIEHAIWVQAGDGPEVRAIADEDLDRSDDEKTSAVHFLRFELDADTVAAVKGGAPVRVGVTHEAYSAEVTLPEPARASLLADLD